MATILVVDDDRSIRHLVRLSLGLEGHEIYEANDGVAALELVRDIRPDVVLLDIGLPRVDGLELLRRLQRSALRDATRIILVTGSVRDEALHGAWGLGIDAAVSKPFELDDLARCVREVLGGRGAAPDEGLRAARARSEGQVR